MRLFMREGKIVASSHSWLKQGDAESLGEVYRRAILEFYSDETPFTARAILTAHPFDEQAELAEILSRRLGKKIRVTTPQRGDKKRLIELGIRNARELLRQRRNRPAVSVESRIAELLELPEVPERVEVFDNSHLGGQAPVGAMVVFENGKWDKKSYRHYNLSQRDEYGQMREMLEQRIGSFEKSQPPDLWVIDGGETLRRLAIKLLKRHGTELPVVAVAKEKIDAKAHRAKGAAKDILYADIGELRLPPSDSRLQWFQRLRDEAHRFAISFHKKQRLKEDKKISLLQAKGIGPAKVKKLLDYFGTFEKIKEADFETLRRILSERDARSLMHFFDDEAR